MERTIPNQIFLTSFLVIMFTICTYVNINAQGNNPNVDALPEEWVINYEPSDSEIDVITVNGYDDFNLGTAFAEPHVTQNPLNPLQFFGAFNFNDAYRTNDGHDYLTSIPPFGVSVNGDPCTAYDGIGNLYYEQMFGNITGCKVIRSTNNGATWTSAVTSISGGDRNWMAADQTSGPYSNYVYTSMTRSGFNGHGFARSTNNGSSWTTTFNANNSPLPGAMVCVGPNGTTDGGAVYFVTNHNTTFAPQYTFYVSTDGGATFTLKSTQGFAGYVGTNINSRHSVQNMRTRPYPFIAADNSNGTYRGRLYCVYTSNTPTGSGNKPDIFCRYSDNQGTTWSSAVVVNDDANTTANHQWHPSIWTDTQTGRLYIKWMDTRDTPTSDSAYIYASYSDDGGQTFAANQRISNGKMRINCTTCGGGGTPRYQGDYDAIVGINNQALAMWTDFRAGSFGSYVGYFPDFAMLVNPDMLIMPQDGGTQFVTVEVPDVKLYTNDAIFSATVSPPPGTGTITLDFPGGNTISSFPGSVQLRVQTSGNVTLGSYTITVQGEGPNGTPVHRRNIALDVVIPVELESFTANVNEQDVYLNWATATETNNQGFEIERRLIGEEFSTIGELEGHGTTTERQTYTFTDKNVLPGTYEYRLRQVDFDGTSEYSGPVEVVVETPINYFLSQNYPNPFNPSTTISYSIPVDGNVTLKVFDVLGNKVSTIVDEQKQAGIHDVTFNAPGLSSGVYYYTIKSGNFTSTKKLMLMK